VLKYEHNGRRSWAKELYNQSYYKDFFLAGNDLEILGMDRNFASLKLNRLSSSGDEAEPVLIFNPFESKRTWFQKTNDGVFLAGEQSRQLEMVKIKPDGQKMASFTVAAGRLLGLDQTEAIYLAAEDGSQVAKYSATGNLIWNSRLKRQWNHKMKEDLRPDYLEFDRNQNVYLAGQAQLFTAKPNFYKTVYDRNAVRYFARQKYWRSHGGDRIFIAKFNPDGAPAWINHLVTNQRYPKVGGIAVDRDQNVYLAGNFTFLDARQNLFLAKYNGQGKLVWVKRRYQIPGSLFYIGLVGAFLVISLRKKERVWKLELVILLGLMLLFWGEALV
jgi:outer membrane protein assembly factor BamB